MQQTYYMGGQFGPSRKARRNGQNQTMMLLLLRMLPKMSCHVKRAACLNARSTEPIERWLLHISSRKRAVFVWAYLANERRRTEVVNTTAPTTRTLPLHQPPEP